MKNIYNIVRLKCIFLNYFFPIFKIVNNNDIFLTLFYVIVVTVKSFESVTYVSGEFVGWLNIIEETPDNWRTKIP